MKSALPLCLVVLLLPACADTPPQPAAPQAAALALPAGTVVDLTHTYDEQTIFWPTADGFHRETVADGVTERGYYYASGDIALSEHGGTHLDAPIHFAEGQWAADEIPLDRLMGPAVVVDVADSALANPDYQVTVADLQAWEAAHGPIADGTIVLLRTGYGQFWPDRVRYMGTDARGEAGVAALHFPGLHPDAARWLVESRSVKAVGLDTPSIDYGQSQLFETHQTLFKANVPAFENVASLDRLPETGAVVVALPMKIAGGSGGPLRIIAFVPEG